ncbi:MAG: DUF1501 domain-containing protein [Flavobacteriaceae bacterium]|nr:DUF1501 domain-containing protein [Flavobacteriaceae bacterium]
MKRRTFIKNTIPLAFSPLFVESMIRQKVSKMFGINNAPEDFENRKLLIINLFGGNDGLNTVVPLDQYDLYQSHRPLIKLERSDLIRLNGEAGLGLHPRMTGFKNLYDEGKLNVIQSVGYPKPDFSHFRSDSLVFGGLDGNYNRTINRGWMSNYLANVYPSYNDQPTTQYPLPLGVQLGFGYEHNGFIHEAYNNLGININNIKNWSLSGRSSDSEKNDLMQYLRLIEEGRQVYRRNLKEAYDNGSNSNNDDYPEVSIGKNLRTIARMISGGLDSKILLARQAGYDTHKSQTTDTDSTTGNHGNRLEELSNSVLAFQRDMEAQGFADKIIIIVISEFGRQIIGNGSTGTDHGSLAPWFVIGSPIKGGVTGRNINIGLDFIEHNKTIDVLQHDYRRVLSTIIQDWFGNTDELLDRVGFGDFKGDFDPDFTGEEGTNNSKLDFIKDSEVVAEVDAVNDFNTAFTESATLVPIKTENGWTYYGRTVTSVTYLFAIEHKPEEGNTQDFEPLIVITDLLSDNQGRDHYKKTSTSSSNANFVLGKTWNIVIGSGSVDDFVNMRFFISPSRLDRLDRLATDFKNENSGTKSNALWIRTVDSLLDPLTDFNELGATKGIESIGLVAQGAFETQNYYQFENVTDFDNTGGAICQVVTNKLLGFEGNENPGTIILTESGKLYGYTGSEWRMLFSQ